MSKKLETPFALKEFQNSQIDEEFDDTLNESSSVESSPLIHKLSRDNQVSEHQDLSFLASANFSTDSIAEVDEDILNSFASNGNTNEPSTPKMGSGNILNFSNGHSRRYSISALSSPTQMMRPTPNNKPRPKSAFFNDDSFRNDESVLNTNSSLQSPSAPTSTSGRQNHRRNNYIPPPIIAPPHSSRSNSPTRSTSPTRANKNFRSKSPIRRSGSPVKLYQPFNFTSQEVMLNNGSTPNSSLRPAHRKGHKYKHSSVSMNYFQEPTPSKVNDSQYLNTIPNLYPIPTLRESVSSITKDQKIKLCWSIIHLTLSLIVFISGHRINTPELSTLAHLIFYDSLGSMVIILVEIMSNFEVWNNSSIAYPYGLGRLEVLIGFGLAASLIMVGFDLLSHNFEEFIVLFIGMETEDNHHSRGSHHVHRDDNGSSDSFIYFSVLILTFVVTLVTSNYILAAKKLNKIIKENPTHSRNISNIGILDDTKLEDIGKEGKWTKKFEEFTNIITKNPTYILTLLYTVFLILSPMISGFILRQLEMDANELASFLISLLFCLTGWKLVKALGGILLLSYPSSNEIYNKLKVSITNDISRLDCFKQAYKVEKLFITKFNYEVFVVGVGISMIGGSVDDEARIRFEISRLIRSKLERRQKGTFKMELTIDIDRV